MTSTTPVPRGSLISVRPATWADKERVLAWRNDPAARAASLSTEAIDAQAHARWFAEVLRRGDRLLLVAEAHGRPVATVRFDMLAPKPHAATTGPAAVGLLDVDPGAQVCGTASQWRVSLTVDPACRGQGLGGKALAAALTALHGRGPVTVHAEVRLGNRASCRLFAAAGFSTVAVRDGIASLVRELGDRPGYPRAAEAASRA